MKVVGKKGRSGPPGNLNASKSPWRAFWRRRALKPENKWIVPVLERYAAEMVSDKGGTDSITAGERRMSEIAQVARGATMLILAEMSQRGFTVETDNGWDLAPGVKELAKFLNTERSAIATMGLQRRARTLTLEDVLAEPEEEGSGNAT